MGGLIRTGSGGEWVGGRATSSGSSLGGWGVGAPPLGRVWNQQAFLARTHSTGEAGQMQPQEPLLLTTLTPRLSLPSSAQAATCITPAFKPAQLWQLIEGLRPFPVFGFVFSVHFPPDLCPAGMPGNKVMYIGRISECI